MDPSLEESREWRVLTTFRLLGASLSHYSAGAPGRIMLNFVRHREALLTPSIIVLPARIESLPPNLS